MAETIDLANNSVLVTNPADTDRVAIMRGSSPKTVTLADLAKAVRQSIRFSARNLLGKNLKAGETAAYQIGDFRYKELTVEGEIYSVSAKVTFGSAGVLTFYENPSKQATKVIYGTSGETSVVSFTFLSKGGLHQFGVYQRQGVTTTEGTGASVEWATLVKGEIPLLDWVPAPEDLQNSGGGKTLCLNAFCLNAA